MDDKVGRNDPCPCNSGKKYKKCCYKKDKDKTFSAKLLTGKLPNLSSLVTKKIGNLPKLSDRKVKIMKGDGDGKIITKNPEEEEKT